MAARAIYEFYCNDCDGWILLTLSEALRGRYMVECPNCHHRHPRTFVENGKDIKADVTEVKIAGGKKSMWIIRDSMVSSEDVIQPMLSAYSKKSRIDQVAGPTTDLWVEHANQATQLDFVK